MAFETVREGLTLFYTDDGKGEIPLLFVHGWACDSHDWSWQIPHFAEKARVIAVDLRGHGASTATEDGYEPEVFAEDLVLLLDRLKVDRVVAIGHSLGGSVVAALAVNHPGRVAGVVPIDPMYGWPRDQAIGFIQLAEAARDDNGREVASQVLDRASVTGPEFLRTWHSRRALASNARACAETLWSVWIHPRQFATRPESDVYLARRQCPALSIFNSERRDTVEWAQSLARSPLDRALTLPTGHWAHQEEPRVVNHLIETWIADLPEAPQILS